MLLLVCLLWTAFAESITLYHADPIQIAVSPHDELNFELKSSEPFVYVEMLTCHVPRFRLLHNGSVVAPTEVLSPIGFIYPMSDFADCQIVTAHIENNVSVKMLALSAEKEMPKNSWKISTEVTDQYLKLSFRSIHIPDKSVQASYSVWFSSLLPDINCHMIDNNVAVAEMGVVELPSRKSTESETIYLQIPVNSIYPETSNYTSVNKSQIISLINRNENFAINIIATMTDPHQLTYIYNPAVVEHRLSLMDLEGGLMILLVGIVVFVLVSGVYLYWKRKFKDDDNFVEEQIEVEVDIDVEDADQKGPTEQKMN